MLKLLVMISGNGTNLQAIIDSIKTGSLNAKIIAVISNKANAAGLKRAEQANLNTYVIEKEPGSDRTDFDTKLLNLVQQISPDLIVLAGYMRILSDLFVRRYSKRIINIHPSLLPAYPGLNTHKRVLNAQEDQHGTSVHFVNTELDAGPIIAQAKFYIQKNDTESTLRDKVQKLEHLLYPKVIRWCADNRLRLSPRGVMLDEQLLPQKGGLVFTQDQLFEDSGDDKIGINSKNI